MALASAGQRPSPAGAPDASAVLTKAVVRVADALDLTHRIVARVLGVSEATASRMAKGQYCLKPGLKEYELAALFVRLFRGLDAIMAGDKQAARSWIFTENRALGARPCDLIVSAQGLVNVVAYVDSRRARV